MALSLLPAAAIAATKYAPINRPGPKLEVPRADLKASLVCTDGVRNASRQPVLLLPATAVDSEHNFSSNYADNSEALAYLANSIATYPKVDRSPGCAATRA